eukprot:5209877-Prymnesium_polylepis.1
MRPRTDLRCEPTEMPCRLHTASASSEWSPASSRATAIVVSAGAAAATRAAAAARGRGRVAAARGRAAGGGAEVRRIAPACASLPTPTLRPS